FVASVTFSNPRSIAMSRILIALPGPASRRQTKQRALCKVGPRSKAFSSLRFRQRPVPSPTHTGRQPRRRWIALAPRECPTAAAKNGRKHPRIEKRFLRQKTIGEQVIYKMPRTERDCFENRVATSVHWTHCLIS